MCWASGSKKNKKMKNKTGYGRTSATGTRSSTANFSSNRQLGVKVKQLHRGQVKKDLQATQVESKWVLLQAEVELAKAQLLPEAELTASPNALREVFAFFDSGACCHLIRTELFEELT